LVTAIGKMKALQKLFWINPKYIIVYSIFSGKKDVLLPNEFKNPDTLANFLKLK
jgi:hypothetical protein